MKVNVVVFYKLWFKKNWDLYFGDKTDFTRRKQFTTFFFLINQKYTAPPKYNLCLTSKLMFLN